jgi:uncharacterized protein
MKQNVGWFDIPVTDFDRAMKFYSEVLAVKIERMEHDTPIGVFDHDDNIIGGCLYQEEDFLPSSQGPLLYFNANGRLDEALTKTKANGGKILKPKHSLGPYGFRAVVLDSEGNRIALHSETE